MGTNSAAINRRKLTRRGFVLVLRTCNKDMISHNGFKWPVNGPVVAPDWEANDNCGGGLHGLLWGSQSGGDYLNWNPEAIWMVLRVHRRDLRTGKRYLQDKCKFRRGVVVCCGTREKALKYLNRFVVDKAAVVCGTATAGDSGTATAGDSGTATAGDRGTATAGYRGTATAGHSGTATAGHRGTATAGHGGTATADDSGTATAGYSGTATAGDRGRATAGDSGTATAGYSGTATAGDSGTATAGYSGTATAGDSGTATAGDSGTATAGDSGTATAGDRGTATAGDRGILIIKWYDTKAQRYRVRVAYPGEDGVKPNTLYRCDESGNLIEVGPKPENTTK